VRFALAADVPLLLLHENDEACGGCPFARFFETTPQARCTHHGYGRGHRHAAYYGSTYLLWLHLLGSHQPSQKRGAPKRKGAVLATRARPLLRPLLDGLGRAGGQVPWGAQRRRAALPQDAGAALTTVNIPSVSPRCASRRCPPLTTLTTTTDYIDYTDYTYYTYHYHSLSLLHLLHLICRAHSCRPRWQSAAPCPVQNRPVSRVDRRGAHS